MITQSPGGYTKAVIIGYDKCDPPIRNGLNPYGSLPYKRDAFELASTLYQIATNLRLKHNPETQVAEWNDYINSVEAKKRGLPETKTTHSIPFTKKVLYFPEITNEDIGFSDDLIYFWKDIEALTNGGTFPPFRPVEYIRLKSGKSKGSSGLF
jgi:hypothetical protein